jgi:hypothetical protein
MAVKCHSCLNTIRIDAIDFNALPRLSEEDLRDLGFGLEIDLTKRDKLI